MRQLADLVLPDPTRDGAPAVLRAFTLAGVRPASSPLPNQLPVSAMPVLPTATVLALLPGAGRQIAAAVPAPASASVVPPETARESEPQTATAAPRPEPPTTPHAQRQEPANAPPPPPQHTQPTPPELLEQSAARAMREHLADQVFKPKELADYDRVVALPLAAHDVPTPARLAVATRSTGGGVQATFLRVDAELSRLGSVSIRLSGADSGGPMAITLVASPHAGALLAEELPALVADLRALGVDAGVRVVADG